MASKTLLAIGIYEAATLAIFIVAGLTAPVHVRGAFVLPCTFFALCLLSSIAYALDPKDPTDV